MQSTLDENGYSNTAGLIMMLTAVVTAFVWALGTVVYHKSGAITERCPECQRAWQIYIVDRGKRFDYRCGEFWPAGIFAE